MKGYLCGVHVCMCPHVPVCACVWVSMVVSMCACVHMCLCACLCPRVPVHVLACSCAGTPHYLSPEVCQGQRYDQKSDMWALGCVLYELCALRKPFDGSNLPAILLSIMRSKPEPIDARCCSGAVHVCSRVRARVPFVRYQDHVLSGCLS